MFGHFKKSRSILTGQDTQIVSNEWWPATIYNTVKGEIEILCFWGGNIVDFRGEGKGSYYNGDRWLYFLWWGQFIFNNYIFRFKTDKGFQVDIDLNNESKFSCSRSSFSSQRALKMNQQSIWLVQRFLQPIQSILCECKLTRQQQIKIKKDHSVSKPPVYNTNKSFEEESDDSLPLTDKSLYYATFHKNPY